ncbi:MAG TPA: HlyD family efflux transporter periplasmic adaptor subunit, partial [Pirellulales bacterium]|nr:HlyD family efflux transporter periplasmic adaptor subunit [Pirellulales bacterium]
EPAARAMPPVDAKPPSVPALPPLAPPTAAPRNKTTRIVRLAVGSGLLILAAWSLVPLMCELHSTNARVNAPILTLRSPIAGNVKFHCPTTSGAATNAGAPLFEVKNSLADEDRLDSLNDEKAYLVSRIAGSQRQLASLTDLRGGLSASAAENRKARVRMLQLECDGAQASLENARAVKQQRDFEEDQLRQLQGSRSVSKQDGSAARFAAEAAGHSVVQAEKVVEKLEEQIRGLRGGVDAGNGDGGNDLSYSTQRLHELDCRIEEARASLWQDEAKLAQLERHIRAAAEHLARHARFASVAATDSVVWRRHAGEDTPVQADSPLLDLVNPDDVFIDAVVGESDLKRIRPGDAARVRLPGSRKELKAVVKQVFGHALPWPDACLAAAAVPTTQQEIHVILRLAEPLADGDGGLALPIGLPAEVTFVSTGDALKSLFGRRSN